MDSNDQVFYLTIVGSAVATLGLIIKALSRSKCDNIECGGCLKIHRNIDAEKELDELELARSKDSDSIK